MELGKQIRLYRERDGLSQEKLAEKIYVSRQSISNWENEKSYPDIHNILLLSVLFGVSLDELVKGDVDMMKNEVANDAARSKLKFWWWGTFASMVMVILSLIPLVVFLDLRWWLLTIPFLALLFLTFIQAERLRRSNNIETYAEILAFVENREIDLEELRMKREGINKRWRLVKYIGMILLSAILGGMVGTAIIMLRMLF